MVEKLTVEQLDKEVEEAMTSPSPLDVQALRDFMGKRQGSEVVEKIPAEAEVKTR